MKAFLMRRVEQSKALAQWLFQHWFIALTVVIGYAFFQHYLFVNVTPSLPHTLVWLEYGAQPQRGDLVVYRYAGTPWPDLGYVDGVRFFKRVAGVPGDQIHVTEDRIVSVNNARIGYAKPRTLRGDHQLDVITPGVIPEGYFFAQADSPDSFDSRYASSGLVPMDRVLGVAHPIF